MIFVASFWRNITAVLSFALLATTGAVAQDASIDRLLDKLPPPERLVKPSAQRATEQPDPAFKDPIGRHLYQALVDAEFSAGIELVAEADGTLST
jgi:hypothetical protein